MLKHARARLNTLGPQPRTSDARAALRNHFAANHTLETGKEWHEQQKKRKLRGRAHLATTGHAALAGAEASLTNPFGGVSVEDVGAAFETPAAVRLHFAAWDQYGSLSQNQYRLCGPKIKPAHLVLVCIFARPAAGQHLDQVGAGG